MKELLKKYDIELSNTEIEKFEKFLEIFKEKNSQINLSAIREHEAIIEKHFIDSIMLNIFLDLNEYIPLSPTLSPQGRKGEKIPSPSGGGLGRGSKVADLGTGGGFPGIPLAIVNPEVEFTLIDSVGKKLKAVDDFANTLALKNITTLNGRAEEIGKNIEYREQFDFVVSRATAYFPTLLEYTIPLLKVGGIFAAYKLDDKEELKSAKKALSRLGAKIMKVKNYVLADQKRTIVLIEKISKTHTKYPRNTGVPLSKPL